MLKTTTRLKNDLDQIQSLFLSFTSHLTAFLYWLGASRKLRQEIVPKLDVLLN